MASGVFRLDPNDQGNLNKFDEWAQIIRDNGMKVPEPVLIPFPQDLKEIENSIENHPETNPAEVPVETPEVVPVETPEVTPAEVSPEATPAEIPEAKQAEVSPEVVPAIPADIPVVTPEN